MGNLQDMYCHCGLVGEISHDKQLYCQSCYELCCERMPQAEWNERWLDESGNVRKIPVETGCCFDSESD